MASNFSSNRIVDSATFDCQKCLMNGIGNTVKQYYVNYEDTINMCSVCKGSYLMENEVTVNRSVKKSVSAKSLKKLPLLHFLLKEEPDESLTQDEAKQVLETAYRSYRKSLTREEAQLNDFFSLVSQLLPTATSRNQQNSTALAAIGPQLEDSNSADSEDTFYFSNGLRLSKSEITDDDIDAAISALSSGSSPAINYEDLPDIDSFLAYSEEVDLPILSDETLLSPIHLDKIDETLKNFNENQEIQVTIDFDAMQKMLATPGVDETHKSASEQTKVRSKKVERFLAKSNMRPCDILRKSQQMQLWKQKSENVTSLAKLSKGLDEANAETKKDIVNSLKPESETSVSLFDRSGRNNSNASTSTADVSPLLSALAVYTGQNSPEPDPSDSSYSRDDRKMFKGFEFAEFKGEVQVKSKRKDNLKGKTATLTLIEKLRRKKQPS